MINDKISWQHFDARLTEIGQMQDGWYDGTGQVIGMVGAQLVKELFIAHYTCENLPLPYLYPTFEGGVSCEWSWLDWFMTLKIDVAKQTGTWFAMHIPTAQDFFIEAEYLHNWVFWLVLRSFVRERQAEAEQIKK